MRLLLSGGKATLSAGDSSSEGRRAAMRMFAGLDVGFKRTAVCVVDEAGRIVWRGRVRARSDLGCDFVKMQLHGLAVAGRQYEAAPVPRSSYRGFLDFLLVRDT